MVVEFLGLREEAVKITRLGTGRLGQRLRIMSDEELWWLFLDHREDCLQEFWKEVESRKAAGILSKNSPFWPMDEIRRRCQWPSYDEQSNLIELTREEWEARKHRKMFRVISA
jgi:hypothetical protein